MTRAPDGTPSKLHEYAARFASARTTPIVLETTLGTLLVGQTARTGAEESLTNRIGRPILIDEIRIHCGLFDGAGGTALADATATAGVYNGTYLLTESPLRALVARFKLGNIDLTREFIPVWGLASGYELRADALVAVWRPRVPMYLEDGELLQVQLRYLNYNGTILGAGPIIPNQSVAPHISFVGRVLEDPQDWLGDDEPRALPFASSYMPAAFPMFAVSSSQSSDSSLINGFDTDLYVHKFVGRCVNQLYDCNVGLLDPAILAAAGASPGPLANIPELGIMLRMETSRGLSIIKDPVPFGHVFSPVDSAWWVNTVLKPRESFRAYLDVDFTSPTAFMDDGTSVTASVTMHGTFFCDQFGPSTAAVRVARALEYAGIGHRIQLPVEPYDPSGVA